MTSFRPYSTPRRFLMVLVLAGMVGALPGKAAPVEIGAFSSGNVEGWEIRDFEGQTRYRIADHDDHRVLEAVSEASASIFYREIDVDLLATPVLEWSWTTTGPIPVPDERVKEGDDFAARLYVMAPGEGLFEKPVAITYVWANHAAEGEFWPNPYTDRVMMVVVDSGSSHAHAWRRHQRDVRADFRRYFDREIDRLEGIALMTDSDNSGLEARAWFGDILLGPDSAGER